MKEEDLDSMNKYLNNSLNFYLQYQKQQGGIVAPGVNDPQIKVTKLLVKKSQLRGFNIKKMI